MKIMVIGHGAREHALAWKLAQSPLVSKVLAAPGNAGTKTESKVENLPSSSSDVASIDVERIVKLAKEHQIDFAIVGPAAPLALGIVDAFHANGLKIYGPSMRAAQLESSKSFAKAFMQRHGIPTPEYRVFLDAISAKDYIGHQAYPLVVKADGLAKGEGVTVAFTREQAENAINRLFSGSSHHKAETRIVIEQFIAGEEVSFTVMCDGHSVTALPTSRDYKRLHDNNGGPNTAGMGAYSPAPFVTDDISETIMRDIVKPAIKGSREEGFPFCGFLYVGIILDSQRNPFVLEFNCRLGDPEAQTLLLRLNSDLVALLKAALDGRLDREAPQWSSDCAIAVSIAAEGYPGPVVKNQVISLPRTSNGCKIFHGSTLSRGGTLVTNGDRILSIGARGPDIVSVRKTIYSVIDNISFPGMQYRRDIGLPQ